ncbi:MAG: transposase, partial [Limisphaerales bacterium]
MNPAQRHPSLVPSFPLSYRETSRAITNVESPEPHLGWHSRGYLPHWDHPGMMQSINFRLADSMPANVIEKWKSELGLLPANRRQDAGAPDKCSVELRHRIEKYLDTGYGNCWLDRPNIARVMERALFHFDGQRYLLLAWCIMPNHVHAMIETREGFPLPGIVHSWKSFTANQANKLLERHGEFWQREYLDRYIRHAEHY